tara:strand:+ start:4583 stop:5911 length:1329 start_codon:yes stop_codon:yes gene_type:complete
MACILIVEDEYRLLKTLENILRSQGYHVVSARSGVQACEFLITGIFDLMLLDLSLPDMNGHEVMNLISEKDIDMTTIVLSDETTFQTVSKALRRGAFDYVEKPYRSGDILKSVKNALQAVMLREAQLTKQSNLQQSEKLYRYIVNSFPDIVFMLNNKGLFTFFNNRIESVLGYNKNELIGRHYQTIIDPLDLGRANIYFKEQLENNKSSWIAEFRLKPNNQPHNVRHFEIASFSIDKPIRNTYAAHYNTSGKFNIIGTAKDISERKKAEEFIHLHACHDTVTLLPKKALFMDILRLSIAQAKRNKYNFAIMLLDINGFSFVNDSFRLAFVNKLLKMATQRIENCLSDCDTLAHFDDKFIILLPPPSLPDEAQVSANKIIDALKTPFKVENHEVDICVSIGIASYPNDGDSIDALIQNADTAMQHAKDLGYGSFQHMNNKKMG